LKLGLSDIHFATLAGMNEEGAYKIWYREVYRQKDEDDAIAKFLDCPVKQPGSLKRAREALFLSTRTMAIRLNISQPAYVKRERQELQGSIRLKALAKAAEAMGCELVYCLRPKARMRFSRIIWAQLMDAMARHHIHAGTISPQVLILAKRAYETMMDVDFRRRKEWTQRRPSPE
jgi:hypothetical protein